MAVVSLQISGKGVGPVDDARTIGKQTYMRKKKQNKMKRQPTEWEKISANDAIDMGLISKVYKQLIQQQNKQLNQKMGI